MSDNGTSWYLCNSKTQFQSNPLTWDEARKQCMEILEEDAQFWNVWQESWEGWKPLNQVSDLHSLIKKKTVTPPKPTAVAPPPIPKVPPIPPMPKAVAAAMTPSNESAPVSKTKQAVMVAPKTDGKRKHERYEIRLRVIIRNEQMTFRTFSKDISVGGIALENPVPEHLFDVGCHIFIAGPDGHENLRFDLGPTSRNDLRFFSFSTLDESFVKKLSAWLEKHAKAKPTTKTG